MSRATFALAALLLVGRALFAAGADPAPPATSTPAAAAGESDFVPCLKLVFNKYCLGGPESGLPKAASKEAKGGTTHYLFDDKTMVVAAQGKVGQVVRTLGEGTWIRFRETESDLRSRYGAPSQDGSYFPDYADDDDSRETAISLGKGQKVLGWNQKEFKVGLVWSEGTFGLIYTATSLETALSKAQDNGY